MGMTIDDVKHCLKVMVDHEVCEECQLYGTTGTDHCEHDCVIEALNFINKYQKMQADYENRLKADMVAMLTEIQLEIEEKKFLESSCSFMDKTEEKNYAVYTDEISKLIQQKIDALKEVIENDN